MVIELSEIILKANSHLQWAVVVAQLTKRSLPTPEVRGSNPVISKVFIEYCIEKTKIQKKRSGMAHLKSQWQHWPVWPQLTWLQWKGSKTNQPPITIYTKLSKTFNNRPNMVSFKHLTAKMVSKETLDY